MMISIQALSGLYLIELHKRTKCYTYCHEESWCQLMLTFVIHEGSRWYIMLNPFFDIGVF